MKKYLLTLVIALFLTMTISAGARTFVSIGTGGVTGVYYPTGGFLCDMANDVKDQNIKCTAASTGGSEANVNGVLAGDYQFGMSQADIAYYAHSGTNKWEERGAQTKLRSVFSIYIEAVNLIVSENSKINTIQDLKGKRVNLGAIGSGSLFNTLQVLSAYGVDQDDMRSNYAKPVEGAKLLQDEKIDGYFYTVGHPSGTFKEASAGRILVKFIPIEGPVADSLVKDYPYFTKYSIPHEYYPKATNEADISTIGVGALLVTSTDVSADVVYALTKQVVDNFEDFKKLHQAYSTSKKEDLPVGVTAPLHDGAKKYFMEAGLLK